MSPVLADEPPRPRHEVVGDVAAVGGGAYGGIAQACAQAVSVVSRTEPDVRAASAYNRGYPLWRDLYPALKENFRKMAQ